MRENVNKDELVSRMSVKNGLTKKDSEKALKSFVEVIMEALASGEKVQMIGFGTFEPKDRAERKGRNPKTKEEIVIPATTVPSFKAGKEFKEKVAGK